ncbi:hypothetical protein INT47_002466 [Mucor saturninus]|uniref:F-box domain-containing protein n=1 Tax=Mucor saturninus TaxID=64648 RepID=A0A8H7RFL2_9FUNG|nr:hypothetical protein INT47_002466 [Mucor saturninus]
MVSRSWYAIAVEFVKHEDPWLPLLNYASHQRTYPFRSRLVKLLGESKLSNLIFHHAVRHLVIDFASFDTIRREKSRNNVMVKRKVHHRHALTDVVQLLELCTNMERLDIICDAGFVNLLSGEHNCVSSSISAIQQQLERKGIKRLDLIGFNPIQRCPCCAGRHWDKYLTPLISCLCLDTLVLQHVLPSAQVFQTLALQTNIRKIVLHRSLITIPNTLVDKQGRTNSISRIPASLWHQITSLAIYEDMEDASTWSGRKYLHDLLDHVGPQLQEFTLQFGSKEENEASLSHLASPSSYTTTQITDPILLQLLKKCHLLQIKLVNVPEYQPIR